MLKRLLIHVAGFNLSLIMRKAFGIGTARGMKEVVARILGKLAGFYGRLKGLVCRWYGRRLLATCLNAHEVPATLAA